MRGLLSRQSNCIYKVFKLIKLLIGLLSCPLVFNNSGQAFPVSIILAEFASGVIWCFYERFHGLNILRSVMIEGVKRFLRLFDMLHFDQKGKKEPR